MVVQKICLTPRHAVFQKIYAAFFDAIFRFIRVNIYRSFFGMTLRRVVFCDVILFDAKMSVNRFWELLIPAYNLEFTFIEGL